MHWRHGRMNQTRFSNYSGVQGHCVFRDKGTGGPMPSYGILLRSRRALARARRCQGTSAAFRPRFGRSSNAALERYAAVSFSSVMRWYSAAEHVPCAMSQERRAIVSHENKANSAKRSGSAADRRGGTGFTTFSPSGTAVRTVVTAPRSVPFRHSRLPQRRR